jgi:phosphomannomutase/phosphoglucomutase
MAMNRSIFRKYDVRGIYPGDLDEDSVVRLGFAIGALAGPDHTLAVGRDCRPSGGALLDWLAAGAAAAGCSRILDLGVQTTPMTYFAAHQLGASATVMITGSHNPPEYNGFKIMKGLHTLHGDEITSLGAVASSCRPCTQVRPEVRSVSVRQGYIDRLLAEFCFERPFRIVVDAGNGTGGIACSVLEDLGCRVIPMFCEMDGSFPNHHPDPTVEANLVDLKRKVISEKADLGIAYDGDADRLGVVDDTGETVFGDRTLILLARALLARYPGATVISEVKASSVFFSEVRKAGGKPLMCPTGHSIIKEKMLSENALLAGEMSGHIFFRDRYYGYDDALYASLRLLEVLSSEGKSLSHLLAELPHLCATPEIREDCAEEHKFEIVDKVRHELEGSYPVIAIDGVRVEFPDGWGLVRASNTQPVLVLRFEASSPELLDRYRDIVQGAVVRAMEGAGCQGKR